MSSPGGGEGDAWLEEGTVYGSSRRRDRCADRATTEAAAREWYKSRTFELGAALAFYGIFSIAPVIVLAFTAASLILGKEAAQGRVTQGIESTVGHTVAVAIQTTARYTYQSGSGVPATVLSIVFFGFAPPGCSSNCKAR